MRPNLLVCGIAVLGLVPACGDEQAGQGGSGAQSGTQSVTSGGPAGPGATGPSSSQTGSASAGTGGSEPMADIHYAGRFDETDPDGPRFTWPGTAITTRFEGTGIDVAMKDGGNDFEVVLDGVKGEPVHIDGDVTVTLASGLPAGTHDLILFRRTESFVGVSQFKGFTVPDGQIVPSPSPFAHSIEFIGDSITCGYGVEGTAPCNFTSGTETAYKSYAGVAANTLNAEGRYIAWSGKGVYQNCCGDTSATMRDLYGRTLAGDENSQWDFSKWAPEAVVVYLGTNDHNGGAMPPGAFAEAYADLLSTVQGHYPAASFFCVAGPLLGDLGTQDVEDGIAAWGHECTLVSFDYPQQGQGSGCNGHPSEAADVTYGAVLADAIQTKLGW